MSNIHEDYHRARKVAALAAAVPCGATAEDIAKIADYFAALPQYDRDDFADAIGIKPPSEVTWSALIETLRARKAL